MSRHPLDPPDADPPKRDVACVECGSRNPGQAERCWLCGGSLLTSRPIAAPAPPPGRTIHLGTIMLGIALVAVVLGVAREAPGLAIVLGVLTLPALHRTLQRVRQGAERGQPLGFVARALEFVIALGLALFILTAAAVAFVATCLPVGMASIGIGGPIGVVLAFGLGIAAAVYVARMAGRSLWRVR